MLLMFLMKDLQPPSHVRKQARRRQNLCFALKLEQALKTNFLTFLFPYFSQVSRQKQHVTRSNSQPARPKLKRYSSVEEATEHEKELIRTSLTDLCFRIKSVSRESSLARGSSMPPGMLTSTTSRYSSSSSIASAASTHPPPLMPAGTGSSFQEYSASTEQPSRLRKDSVASRRGLTPDEQAVYNKSLSDLTSKLMPAFRRERMKPQLSLPDSAYHHSSTTTSEAVATKDEMQSSTETVLEKLGRDSQQYDPHEEEFDEDEKPLGTSSPIPSFIQQPQQLNLNPEASETISESEEPESDATAVEAPAADPFLETQMKQRENLLHSRPYFKTGANTSNANPTTPRDPEDYQPHSLSTITSATEKTLVQSPNLSTTSRTLIESEATLKGQPSFESDIMEGNSSRTVLGHNDTFDTITDIDELSFDH